MKKIRNRKYRHNNNQQASERGGGGKDFARDLTEWMTREKRKNYWVNTSVFLLNPDTALYLVGKICATWYCLT